MPYKDPEAYRAYQAKWKRSNKARISQYMKEYYQKHKDERREYMPLWRKENGDKIKQYSKKYWAKNIKTLTDQYIRSLLTANGCTLKQSDIPQELVELKRAQIALEREIR